ncbi:phospholipase carboxylesterase [Liquorilactobacillus oeni DSM 19972]|uniref:Phospholipase carboxylesterase n=1 Tax=Liquorilactobacillus oeni DSM 19972 TaxID=1423777 RepID=A0A0R1M7C5_9LACO|nr:phospholipase carboxylesterase [Liquorilactobacillus oeni DSM 19972]
MHGLGSNYLNLRKLAALYPVPVIELHIEGALVYGNGFAYYTPQALKKNEAEVIEKTADALYTEIIRILKENNLICESMNIIGFSQGAILAAVLSARYPKFFDNAVLLSARLPDFLREFGQKKLSKDKIKTACFIAQGEFDPIFPVEEGRRLRQFFSLYSCVMPEYHEYPYGHKVSRQTLEDIYNWFLD